MVGGRARNKVAIVGEGARNRDSNDCRRSREKWQQECGRSTKRGGALLGEQEETWVAMVV